jgi:hypothetical protein
MARTKTLKLHQKRSLRPHRLPDCVELRAMSKTIRGLRNVIGCYVGHKEIDGRRTRQLAWICLVKKKVAAKRLVAEERVPRIVEWTERGRSRRIQTDVIQIGATFRYQSANVVGPGDLIAASGERGTVGAALNHAILGRCFTTARHVVDGAPIGSITVTSQGQEIQARVARLGTRADYALLKPLTALDCDNLWEDTYRVGPVYIPSEHDVDKPLYVLTTVGARGPLRCRGVYADLNLPGGPSFQDVILTEAGTYAGDSGCCLVDEWSRIWGFLVGRLGNDYSIFVPAISVVMLENAIVP